MMVVENKAFGWRPVETRHLPRRLIWPFQLMSLSSRPPDDHVLNIFTVVSALTITHYASDL